jgi:ABC-type Fe3+-siderophore transport system permease subunit
VDVCKLPEKMTLSTRSPVIWILSGTLLIGVTFILELMSGPVRIPFSEVFRSLTAGPSGLSESSLIIWQSRLPRAITALGAGSALALAGLLMQTLFRNPLAGPSILGISSGASLAVGLLIMGQNLLLPDLLYPSSLAVALAAMAGAILVLLIVLAVSWRLNHSGSLLLFGILLGHFVSALETVLQHRSDSGALRSFMVWGMGRFSDTSLTNSIWLIAAATGSLLLTAFLTRSLNLLLLGENYSRSMGLRVMRIRLILILITGLSAGTVTAFCGPVAFIGLATPHIARMLLRTSNHSALLLPLFLFGGSLGLFADLCSRGFGVPLNAVTSLIGAPIVLSIIIRSGKSANLI